MRSQRERAAQAERADQHVGQAERIVVGGSIDPDDDRRRLGRCGVKAEASRRQTG